jgi:hypothetical protein
VTAARTVIARRPPPVVPLTERCRSFHAVITGSVNDHRSSDKSLGYGLRSFTR